MVRLRNHRIFLREAESEIESEDSFSIHDTSTSLTDISDSETSSSNSNPTILNNTSIENNMDEVINNIITVNKQREAERENYKKKSENQESIISSVKKCLNMDKLEVDFETYKKDMALKMKNLDEAKLKTENTLKRKYDNAINQLNTEKSLRLSAENSRMGLQKKVYDLIKELKNEKALRSTAEDRVFLLENNLSKTVAMNSVIPIPKSAIENPTVLVEQLNRYVVRRFPFSSIRCTQGRNMSSLISLPPQKWN